MSSNNQPLSGNALTPLQRVSLNSSTTNVILDSDSGNSSFIVSTGATASLYIDKFSNVGINTITPSAQLEIASNNGSCLRLCHSVSSANANLYLSSGGDLSITSSNNQITTTASLNIINHNGTTTGLFLGNSLVNATAEQLNYLTVSAGTASASKALVLDSSRGLTGIDSITSSNLYGLIRTAAQPHITSLGTLTSLSISGNLNVSGSLNLTGSGSIADTLGLLSNLTLGVASASKALVVDSLKDIIGINSISSNSVVIAGSTIGSEASYISGVIAGTASNSKSLVLNSIGNISGINSLSASELSGTIQTSSQPNITSVGSLSSLTIGSFNIGSTQAGYLSGVVAGTASNSKVLVLDSSGNISGINSLSTSQLSGTIQTSAQSNITSLGTLTSLSISGSTVISSTIDSSNYATGGALTISGGIAVAKNAYIGSNLTIGGNLIVSGTSTIVNSTSISIQDNTIILNATPTGGNDSGMLIARFQTANDTSTGSVISDPPNLITTINSATSSSVVLSTGSSINNYYQGWWLKIGSQIRKIASYNGTSKTITTETQFTTTPTNGSAITLYDHVYASMTWNEANKRFIAAYNALDSSTTLTSIDNADLLVSTLYTSGKCIIQDSTDASSVSSGSLLISGGVGISKSLYVGTGIYGTIQTSSQPNITSLGTLTSLLVSGGITGTIQTSSQPNITSLGTLTGLNIGSSGNHQLSLTNLVSSSTTNIRFIGNQYVGEFGIIGSSSSTNPSTMYMLFNNNYALLIDASGNVSIGTSSFGYKLNIGGSVNASSYSLSGVSLSANLISGSITAGVAAASKSLSVDSQLNVSGINSLSATNLTGTIITSNQPNITSLGSLSSLTIGSSTISSTDASYLSGLETSAIANKALVLNSNKDIIGVRVANLSGTNELLNLINTQASGYVASTLTTDTNTLSIGVRGSSNSVNPNTVYWHYNSDYRLLMNPSGEVSIGTSSFGYRLNIGGSINASSFYLNGTLIDLNSIVYVSAITAGTAAPNKALILNGSSDISGINSLSASTLILGGTTLNGTYASYIDVSVAGSAAANKALILDINKNISGINSLSASTLIVNGVDVSSSITASGFITGITAGTASASKALVLDSNKSISGITSLSSTNIVLGSNTLTTTEAGYLTSLTAGTASASKALVIDSTKNISGVNYLTASSLDAANFYQSGVALSFAGLGYVSNLTLGTASASKALVLDSNTSISGINSLSATAINASGYSLSGSALNFSGLGYITSITIGTASASKSMVLDASKNISGVNSFTSTTINATNYQLNSVAVDFSGLSFITGITAGSASASKALVLDSSKGISGITSLSSTNIILGSNTLTATEAGYLTSLTAGTASSSKALVLNSSGAINGIQSVGITGTGSALLTLTNTATTTTSKTAQLIVSNTYSLEFGVLASTNSTNPNTAYWFYNAAYRMLMNASGEVSIGTNTFGYRLNVFGSINASSYYDDGILLNFSGLSFITGITAGTAANNKSLVLNSSGSISGITSLGATTLILGGTSLGATEAGYVSGITAGTASASKALVLNGSTSISGITSLGTTTLILGGTSLGATEAGYISGITAGTASASKALVLNGSANISGINNLTTTTLTLGSTALTTTQAAYLTSITAGTAAASKAMILNSSKSISGIVSLSATDLTGTLQTADQPNITSLGSLTSGLNIEYNGNGIVLTSTASNNRTSISLNADVSAFEIGVRGSTASTTSGSLYIQSTTSGNSGTRFALTPSGYAYLGVSSATAVTAASSAYRLYVDGKTYIHGMLIMSGVTTTNNNYEINTSNLAILPDGNTYTNADTFSAINVVSGSLTNSTTAANSTSAFATNYVSINQPTIRATNLNITQTTASTLYIQGAPIAGTNTTITNSWALNINSGNSRFADNITVNGNAVIGGTSTISGNVGISTTSPLYKLDLGTEIADRILSLSSDGSTYYGFGINSSRNSYLANDGHSFYAGSTRSLYGLEIFKITNVGNSLGVLQSKTFQITNGASFFTVDANVALACLDSSKSVSNSILLGYNTLPGNYLDISYKHTTTGSSSNYASLQINGNSDTLTITNSNRVGIGLNNPAFLLEVADITGLLSTPSSSYVYYNATDNNAAYTSSTMTISARFRGRVAIGQALYVTSDIRLKKDIVSLDVDFCKRFISVNTPVEFTYRSNNSKSFGYIAQELLNNGYGSLITDCPDENMEMYEDEYGNVSSAGHYFNVSYLSIIPILAKNIKTVFDENETLRNEVDELKQSNVELLNMIKKLSDRLDCM